jgi:hypothetical protein
MNVVTCGDTATAGSAAHLLSDQQSDCTEHIRPHHHIDGHCRTAQKRQAVENRVGTEKRASRPAVAAAAAAVQ